MSAEASSRPSPGKFADVPLGGISGTDALKITALLAAVGFIVKLSHQQLLGIDLTDWSALNLSILAGKWAIETLTLLLQQPLCHLLFAALFIAPVAAYLALPLGHRFSRPAVFVSFTLSTICLSWVLLFCEIPTLGLQDWLTKPLASQLEPNPNPGFLSGREERYRANFFLEKMGGLALRNRQIGCPVPPAAKTSTAASAPAQTAPPPGPKAPNAPPNAASSSPANSPGSPAAPPLLAPYMDKNDASPDQTAANRLRTDYALSVLFCLLGWLTLSFTVPSTGFEIADESVRVIRLGLRLFLIPAVTVLLPYMYGKLILSSEYPRTTVKLAEPSPEDPQRQADEQVLLLDQTDKDLTILWAPRELEIPSRRVVPRDAAQTLQLSTPEDVLSQSMKNCNWLPNP